MTITNTNEASEDAEISSTVLWLHSTVRLDNPSVLPTYFIPQSHSLDYQPDGYHTSANDDDG